MNCQSVTKGPQEGSARKLDSAGCNWASDLANREATRVGLPWDTQAQVPQGSEGLKGSVAAEKTGNDQKSYTPQASGSWRQNGRKRWWVKQ